jgi:hypothetical protein
MNGYAVNGAGSEFVSVRLSLKLYWESHHDETVFVESACAGAMGTNPATKSSARAAQTVANRF